MLHVFSEAWPHRFYLFIMFVRELKKANGTKSIQIVQSIREGKKVKQKVIRHLGQWKHEHEIEKIKKTAEEIIVAIKNGKYSACFNLYLCILNQRWRGVYLEGRALSSLMS